MEWKKQIILWVFQALISPTVILRLCYGVENADYSMGISKTQDPLWLLSNTEIR